MKIVATYPLGLAPSVDMKPGHYAILVLDDKEEHFEEYVVRRDDAPDAKMDAVAVDWRRVSTRDASGWTWTSHDTFVESIPCLVLEEMTAWCQNPALKLAAVLAAKGT